MLLFSSSFGSLPVPPSSLVSKSGSDKDLCTKACRNKCVMQLKLSHGCLFVLQVDISGLDLAKFDDKYFAKPKSKKAKKSSDGACPLSFGQSKYQKHRSNIFL